MVEEMSHAPLSGAIQNLFGAGDENVRLLEQLLHVHIALRGGEITVEGEEESAVDTCERVLGSLEDNLRKMTDTVDGVLRTLQENSSARGSERGAR